MPRAPNMKRSSHQQVFGPNQWQDFWTQRRGGIARHEAVDPIVAHRGLGSEPRNTGSGHIEFPPHW